MRCALRMQPANAEADGRWVPADGQAKLNLFWKLNEKNPQVCLAQRKWAGAYPCPAERLSADYVNPSLDPLDPARFMNLTLGKTVSFIGDSLNQQFFEDLVCDLSEVAPVFNVQRPDFPTEGINTEHPDWGFHQITFDHNTVFQSLCNKPLHYAPSILDADVIILNYGAHYKEWLKLEQDLKHFNEVVRSSARPGAKFLWREYSPTHFGKGVVDYMEIDLEMSEQSADAKCLEVSRDQYDSNNFDFFRRHKANALMTEMGWEMLKIWEPSSQQPNMHVETNGDCRHWCRPSPVFDVWQRLLAAAMEPAKV